MSSRSRTDVCLLFAIEIDTPVDLRFCKGFGCLWPEWLLFPVLHVSVLPSSVQFDRVVRGGSVVSSVPSARRVAGSNPTLAAM